MQYEIEIIKPDELPSPLPNITRLLDELHQKIGQEQLEMRLESILTEWALNSGYEVEIEGQTITFKHVSINL